MQATQIVAHKKSLTRLTHGEDYKLRAWYLVNAGELDDAPAWRIAQAASNELGFDVSPYTLVNIRKWRRMENRVSALEAAIENMVSALEAAEAAIERQELNPIA